MVDKINSLSEWVQEHWLSLIDHQVRATQHNTKILLRQHHTIKTHLRTMRLEARNEAKDRALGSRAYPLYVLSPYG